MFKEMSIAGAEAPVFIRLGAGAKDMTGMRFGRLIVLGPVARGWNNVLWLYRCDCGAFGRTATGNFRRARSCGCLRTERIVKSSLKHGHARAGAATTTYRSWEAMRARCECQTHQKFEYYGGRGIKVCPSWRENFAAFLADMGPRPPGTTLDRIDNDKDYEPGNCRWADRITQRHNRRDSGEARHV